jgi:hypothetical protein
VLVFLREAAVFEGTKVLVTHEVDGVDER